MVLAILELGNLQGDLAGVFLRFFLDAVELGAEPLVREDLFLELPRRFGVLVEPVVDGSLGLVHEPCAHFGVAELVFRLALEHRRLYLDGNGGCGSLAHVLALVVLAVVFVDTLEEAFLERGQVGAAVGGILAVDERKIVLAVVVGMGEGDLELLALVVAELVDVVLAHLGVEKVQESVLRHVFLAVEVQDETGVEVGIVPDALFEEFEVEREIVEEFAVRNEFDEGAVLHVALDRTVPLALEHAALEHGLGAFAVANRHDAEPARKRVDGLRTDPVEADGKLEDVVVVFRARIDDGHALDDLAQRYAAAVVAHRYLVVLECDVDLLSVSHDELVDGVVDHFLGEHIDAVIGIGAVAEPPDVHAGTKPDVLE